MHNNCVTHEIMSSNLNKRVPAVPSELQGGVSSVEVEALRSHLKGTYPLSPMSKNCRGPEPAEVNVCKHEHATPLAKSGTRKLAPASCRGNPGLFVNSPH